MACRVSSIHVREGSLYFMRLDGTIKQLAIFFGLPLAGLAVCARAVNKCVYGVGRFV
jgi:hypothetical protein